MPKRKSKLAFRNLKLLKHLTRIFFYQTLVFLLPLKLQRDKNRHFDLNSHRLKNFEEKTMNRSFERMGQVLNRIQEIERKTKKSMPEFLGSFGFQLTQIIILHSLLSAFANQ